MYNFKVGNVVVLNDYPTMMPMTIVGTYEGPVLHHQGDYRCQWFYGLRLCEELYSANNLVKIRE